MHVTVLFLQKDSSQQPELQYDEFGFRVDTEGISFIHDFSFALSHSHTQTILFHLKTFFYHHLVNRSREKFCFLDMSIVALLCR